MRWLIILAVLVLAGYGSPTKAKNPDRPFYYRGINLTSWQTNELSKNEALRSLDQLRQTAVNCVMVVPTWYMPTEKDNEVFSHPARSATEADLRKILSAARQRGLRTALKPHVDCLNGVWRGFIDPEKPDKWFMTYGYYLSRMAKIATEEKCDFLVIGTEFKAISGKYPDKWQGLIAEIKHDFRGPLTYAANWDEYQQVKFWRECDFLGVEAYFPLSDLRNPTLQELINGWNKEPNSWLTKLEAWHKEWQKPIVFTEIGYTSWDYAGRRPWVYSDEIHHYNGKLQARCYQAVITATAKKKWLGGIFFWNWEPKVVTDASGKMTLPPQGKPAMAVLKSWPSPR